MTPPSSPTARWRRLIPLAVLVVAAIVVFTLDLDRYLTIAALREHKAALQDFAHAHLGEALLIYAGLYIAVVALSLPGGTIMTLAGGFLFGTWLGGAVTVVAATVGATIIFLAAQSAIGDSLKTRAGPWLKRFEEGFRRDATSYLLILRLVPAFPFFVVNIAPAFLGVRPGLYIATTFIGIIPGTLVYASVGSGLGAILDAGRSPDLGIIFAPEVLFPLLALSALSLLPMALRMLGVLKAPNGK